MLTQQLKLTDTRYGKMIYPIDDPAIGRSLELYGEYCQPEIEILKKLITPTSWFIDVGANIGTHSVALSHFVERVISFEPDLDNFNILKKNVERLKNVSVTHLALGDWSGEVDTEFDFGKTKIKVGNACKISPMDMLGIPKIDLVKIDVEGMELQVLIGMRNILTINKPDLLIEMQDETKYAETFDFLRSVNYNMCWLPVATYSPTNYKENSEDVFGPQHGVINWVCCANELNTTLQPVVDRDDTVNRMEYRRRKNVGNDRKDVK